MEIRLDEKTKADVIMQAKKQLVADLIAQFNLPQIAAEIRNAAVKEVAAKIHAGVKADERIDEAVHRAIQGAESHIHSQINKALAGGIKVSFPALAVEERT
jgi:hypothetical protein